MAVQDPGRMAGFPCQQCGIVCPNMPTLLDHMEVHCQQEDDRKFKCDECGRGYRHAGSLANHKKTHEIGSFECEICGKENSNALALKSHLRSHTSQKKYSCEECGKAFRLATQLATHERVHQARREKRRPSRKAGVNSSKDDNRDGMDNYQPYLRSKRSGGVGISIRNSSSEHKVDVCNTQAEASDEDVNRPFKCDMCDKSYIHFRSLAYHKKTHQMGTFECKMCFKQFSTMGALYNHQRTHKSGSGADHCSQAKPYSNTPQGQFSPQNNDPSVNFCHLCQVLYTNEDEFQEHIQMHNSSSLAFGLQNSVSENPNVSYNNGIASPESNFYASPIDNMPSVSSMNDHRGFDHPQEKRRSNGHMFSNSSSNQTPSSNSIQQEPQLKDINTPPENNSDEIEDASPTDSEERPFKCEICGKSYRHSGSLINHKRSHQVGIYQCSICRKNYPHLAALKSHLRLHKANSSSFNLNGEGDWLSSEPLTMDNQQGCFSPQNGTEEEGELVTVVKQEQEDEEVDKILGMHEANEVDHSNGDLYHERFNQEVSQDMTVHLPQNEHLMQRHMCADCGETFADIVGIKSHICPLLQQQHNSTIRGYGNSLAYQASDSNCTLGNPATNAEFHGHNRSDNQTYFEQKFHDNMSRDRRNGEGVNDTDEEDDSDLFQCSICGNNYTSMRALRSHLRGHTQSQGTPPSSGPSSMSSHEEVKDEHGEMMICSTCGESFANRQDLIIHQLLHNDNKVDNVNHSHMESDVPESKAELQNTICGTCGIFCTSYHHLKNHGCSAQRNDEMMHAKEGMNVNLVSQFEDSNPIRETVQNTKNRQYRCDQCGRSYRHPGSLLNHKKSHKTGVFRCLVCQKRFYNLLALKNHQRSHFDIKRHTCNECGKAFKIQKQLLNHLRRHKENQAKIQELNNQIQALMQMNRSRSDRGMQTLASNANQAFTRTQRRKQPLGEKERKIKVETSVNSEDTGEQRPFTCDQCGRSYRHAGSLVNHKNSHKTGEYYCSVCNNTYSNQLAMKNHMRTHFALKRHACQTCGRGFRGKKQLLAHVCAGPRKDGTRGRRVLKSRAIRCKACKKAFVSGDQLAAHICEGPSSSRAAQFNASLNKEERPFTCNICNRSYRHAGSLLNHKNTHKTGHFSCTFCSKPFTNPMALRNHTRIHTQKKKYVCLTCGKAFRLASILHNHQRVHNRAGGHLSCQTCGKSFQGRSGMKRHRCCRAQGSTTRSGAQQPEKGEKCFTCDLCGRSYHHAGSLLNHKKTHSENLHHCTLCLQTFPDALTLQIHSQMRRHCCPECGKTFCLVSHLQSHMEVHAKDRTVLCGICKQSFPNPASYQEHHNRHHAAQSDYQQDINEQAHNNVCWDSGMNRPLGMAAMPHEVPPPLSHITGNIAEPQKRTDDANEEKSHVCEHCGRTYRHAGSLLNHKNSHKTGSYFCTVCQKEFTNLMALKNHRRIHTEPKRYQCLDCGKAFRVSTQLICHRRIHTKEKPFACMLCDKSFSSKSNLRHHQKMHQSSQAYDSSFSMDDNEFMDLDMGSFL